MNKFIEEFFNTIKDSKGNISSRRFNEKYFNSINKTELWNTFQYYKNK